MKVARSVWSGGKAGDCIKGLPITIIWLPEKDDFIPFDLATLQYQGRTLQEVIDLKQQEKAMRDQVAVKNLQANIDLMSDIQDIVKTASSEAATPSSQKLSKQIKSERKKEKNRLRRAYQEDEESTDLLSILQKQQNEEFEV